MRSKGKMKRCEPRRILQVTSQRSTFFEESLSRQRYNDHNDLCGDAKLQKSEPTKFALATVEARFEANDYIAAQRSILLHIDAR